MSDSLISPAHTDAIDRAQAEMEKMFDSFVIIGLVKPLENNLEQITYRYGGGCIQMLGLIDEFKREQDARAVVQAIEGMS